MITRKYTYKCLRTLRQTEKVKKMTNALLLEQRNKINGERIRDDEIRGVDKRP